MIAWAKKFLFDTAIQFDMFSNYEMHLIFRSFVEAEVLESKLASDDIVDNT